MAGSRVYREFPSAEKNQEGGQRPLLSTTQLNIGLEDEGIIVPYAGETDCIGKRTLCQPD